MARWFTSDLHFGHTNIIRYCNRPFPSVGAMNAGLIALWNERVVHDDEVWVLGDVVMGRVEETLHLVSQLTGTKVLVTGNHDRCWGGAQGKRAQLLPEWRDRYRRVAGFEEILDGCVEVDLDGRPVFACHFPYHGDSVSVDRYVEHRPVDDGHTWLLHGHVHTSWRLNERMINVGVDAWDYRPVAESDLVALIAEADERDRHLTIARQTLS